MIVCYFDIQAENIEYAKLVGRVNAVWIYTWAGGENIVVERIKEARNLGFKVILNIQGHVWNIYTWRLRPSIIADWIVFHNRLVAENLWDTIVGFYVIDEPFHNAVSLAQQNGQNTEQAKQNMLEDVKFICSNLKAVYPDKARLVIFAFTELLSDHASFMLTGLNGYVNVVGFDHYSYRDESPHGDSLESYAGLYKKLKQMIPAEKYVLVPDGIMFDNDLTMPEKLERIKWICALGWNDPDTIGIIPYCWSVDSLGQTGIRENPEIYNLYSQLGPHLMALPR